MPNNDDDESDLQGVKATITTNIVNISKLTEIHLITKKHTMFTPIHQTAHTVIRLL